MKKLLEGVTTGEVADAGVDGAVETAGMDSPERGVEKEVPLFAKVDVGKLEDELILMEFETA